MKKFYRSFILIFLLGLALSGCFSLSDDIKPPPGSEVIAPAAPSTPTEAVYYPFMAPNPQAGAVVFAEKCQPCHGESGLGNGPQAADLPNPVAPIGSFDFARQATPALWYKTVTEGRIDRYMPPFNSLSDRQRWDVVSYVFSLSISANSMAQGQIMYEENCLDCHGTTGQGDGTQAASLSSALPSFTNQKRMAELSDLDIFDRTIHSGVGNMPSFENEFNDEERWAVVSYVRSLSYITPGLVAEKADTADTNPPEGITGEVSPEGVSGHLNGLILTDSGASLDDDMEVILYAYDNFQQTFTTTLSVADDGTFTFLDENLVPGRAYIAAVDFQGVTFTSDIVVAENDFETLDLQVQIFETTTEKSMLFIDRLHIFFEFLSPEIIRIVELFAVSNPDNRVVVADQPQMPVLTFQIPEGATNLQFQDGALGGRYISTPGGFGDTKAIYPAGQQQILFSFDMPYDKEVDISQFIELPVSAVLALLPQNGVKLKGDQFLDNGTRDVQGEIYQVYTIQNQPAETNIEMVLSGRPKGIGASAAGGDNTLAFGMGAFGVMLLVAGVWLYRQQRVSNDNGLDDLDADFENVVKDETGELLFPPMINGDPETVMDTIIALDEQYQSGEIHEEAYLQRRDALKSHLRKLLQE